MATDFTSRRIASAVSGERGNDNTRQKDETRCFRIQLAASLCSAFFTVGVLYALLGVTFLDLIAIAHSKIKKGSLIFVLSGLGSLFGSSVSGPLCDRVRPDLILSMTLLATGALMFILPWQTSFPVMLAVDFGMFTTCGMMQTAMLYVVITTWNKSEAQLTQAVFLSLAIGGIVGPVITEPFLRGEATAPDIDTRYVLTHRTYQNTTSISESQHVIFIPYSIAGAIHVVAALPWIFFFCTRSVSGNRNKTKVNDAEMAAKQETEGRTQGKHLICLPFIALFYTCFNALDDGFKQYVTTILVHKLRWTQSDGAKATTVFCSFVAGGRLAGIGLARIIPPPIFICVCLVGLNISLVLWALLYEIHSIVTWMFMALIGLFISTIFPTSVVIFGDLISSGVVASIIVGFSDIGNSLFPLLIGYLLELPYPMASVMGFLAAGVISLLLMTAVQTGVFSKKEDGHESKQ